MPHITIVLDDINKKNYRTTKKYNRQGNKVKLTYADDHNCKRSHIQNKSLFIKKIRRKQYIAHIN